MKLIQKRNLNFKENKIPDFIFFICFFFIKFRKRRKFSEVPYSYNTTIVPGRSLASDVVFTERGDLIPSTYDFQNNNRKTKKCTKSPKISVIHDKSLEVTCYFLKSFPY